MHYLTNYFLLEPLYQQGVVIMTSIKQLTGPQFEALFPDEAACDTVIPPFLTGLLGRIHAARFSF